MRPRSSSAIRRSACCSLKIFATVRSSPSSAQIAFTMSATQCTPESVPLVPQEPTIRGMPAVLALAAAAVVAGSRSFTAIAGWAADVPADVLDGLYRRCGAARPGARPPSKATIWRVVTGADAAAFDAVTGSWLMERASAAGSLACPGHGGDDDAPLIPVRVDGLTPGRAARQHRSHPLGQPQDGPALHHS